MFRVFGVRREAWLFQGVGAGFGADAVVVARVARDADGSDDLAVHHDGDTAFDWDGSFQTQHTDARAAGGDGVLKRLGGTFEAHRRARFTDGHLRASELRVVHFFVVHQ